MNGLTVLIALFNLDIKSVKWSFHDNVLSIVIPRKFALFELVIRELDVTI